MKLRQAVAVAIATAVWCGSSAPGAAQTNCSGRVSRTNVVPCAIAASALIRAEDAGVRAARGRERTAGALLPSNPTFAFSGARRTTRLVEATNWYGTLSQEVEIAGQRRARMRAAEQERRAQESGLDAIERDVAADALRTYFEVLAARDLLELAKHMEQTFGRATEAAKAAAARGASAGIDADIAELSGIHLTQERITAQRRYVSALATLTALMGLDPATHRVQVEGELVPLQAADGSAPELGNRALAARPEVDAADAMRGSFEAWSDAYRRGRAPNLTFSLTAQRDGFNERVLGAGVSIPITLPAPVGRDFSGQSAENAALARRSRALLTQTERDVRLEVFTAREALVAAQAERALFTDERAARSAQTLDSIAREIAAGRVAINTVLYAQQALIEFLHERVASKLTLCLASVDLVHAAGLRLDGGAP